MDLTLPATDAIGNVIAVGLSGGASQEESNLVRSQARFQDSGVGNDEILSTTECYYIVRGIHRTRAGARGVLSGPRGPQREPLAPWQPARYCGRPWSRRGGVTGPARALRGTSLYLASLSQPRPCFRCCVDGGESVLEGFHASSAPSTCRSHSLKPSADQ